MSSDDFDFDSNSMSSFSTISEINIIQLYDKEYETKLHVKRINNLYLKMKKLKKKLNVMYLTFGSEKCSHPERFKINKNGYIGGQDFWCKLCNTNIEINPLR